MKFEKAYLNIWTLLVVHLKHLALCQVCAGSNLAYVWTWLAVCRKRKKPPFFNVSMPTTHRDNQVHPTLSQLSVPPNFFVNVIARWKKSYEMILVFFFFFIITNPGIWTTVCRLFRCAPHRHGFMSLSKFRESLIKKPNGTRPNLGTLTWSCLSSCCGSFQSVSQPDSSAVDKCPEGKWNHSCVSGTIPRLISHSAVLNYKHPHFYPHMQIKSLILPEIVELLLLYIKKH